MPVFPVQVMMNTMIGAASKPNVTLSRQRGDLRQALQTPSTGPVTWRVTFEPNSQAPFTPTSTSPSCVAGQDQPNKLGSYHCWNRIYEPNTGRWTTPDPAATPWSNLWSHVGSRPLQSSDPSGLGTWEDPNSRDVGYKKTVIESALREETKYSTSAWTTTVGSLLWSEEYICPTDPEKCITCREYSAVATRSWFWITEQYEDKWAIELEVIKKPIDWGEVGQGALLVLGGGVAIVAGGLTVAGGVVAIKAAPAAGPGAPLAVIGGALGIVAGAIGIVSGVVAIVSGLAQIVDGLNIGEKIWQVNSSKLLSSVHLGFEWARGTWTSRGTYVSCDKECRDCCGYNFYLEEAPKEGFSPRGFWEDYRRTDGGKGGPNDKRPEAGFSHIAD